ncbi:MAG: hypothetical protein NC924_05610, partial [Candidatus Omnitrophica bacterium]|nr:hypothetical protein [Candidatus Omnitrophota bacterium]
YTLWLMLEPYGFVRNAWLGMWQRLIACLGPAGARIDRRSIQAEARTQGIPIVPVQDVNAPEFVEQMRGFAPDVIINQTELLLKEALLAVPKRGVVNRHASLLPHYRGRVGSWWSHAAQPPEYGVTIHFVEREIDAGPIILQKSYAIDPRRSYTEVLDILFSDAPQLMLEALEKIEDADFVPQPNRYKGTRTYLFPTLDEVRAYRKILKQRRQGVNR